MLKNLLSNAFKFTEQGGVSLSVSSAATAGAQITRSSAAPASVIAFEVSDTGIGIPAEKQRIIFEAFQQADAGTSRKYGGTGLGLAISRELASLLGGEIQLTQRAGKGSTFTLYLPQTYVGPATAAIINADRRCDHGAMPRSCRTVCVANERTRALRTIATISKTGMPSCLSWKTIRTTLAFSAIFRAIRDSKCWSQCAAPRRWR